MKKENGKRKWAARGLLTLALALAFCLAMPKNAEAAVRLSKKSVTVLKGKIYTIQVKGTRQKAVWKTSRPATARIIRRKAGSVQIRAVKTGTSTISAGIKGKTYKCKVRVVDPKLSSTKLRIQAGSRKVLSVKGGSGKITWKSSNPSVASVSGGKVTALKAGEAKITATQNKKKMTCTVTIRKKAAAADPGNTKPEPSKPKKVWVVTKEAWTEQWPVYTNIRSEWECSCGYKTENLNEFTDHQDNNWTDEHARSRVNTLKDFSHMEFVEHPEEGYWKTIE